MTLLILLLVCGVILLTLEAMLPGMILGAIGIACWAGAVYVGYTQLGTTAGNLTILGVVLLSSVGFLLWLKFFPQSPVGRVFVSNYKIGDLGERKDDLVGQKGESTSRLSPSGYARIGGKKMDVVAAEGYLDAGTPVVVVDVSGNRIVVRRVDDSDRASNQT